MTPQEYWLLRELRLVQDKMSDLNENNEYHRVLREQYESRIREIRRQLARIRAA